MWIRRAYDEPSKVDGTRILVDRLWPRGVSRERLRIDRWLSDLAPSTELRRWFGHDPNKWDEFQRRYRAELAKQRALLDELEATARKGRVTLVYGARDEAHNNAVVLRDLLEERLAGGRVRVARGGTAPTRRARP